MENLKIRGARTHNLKNINLDLPRNKLTVITGLSGSGKSSLAFDTLYAEGQRRYVESLSAYARQFLQLMEKPDVDLIEGLSPAISIEQKATSHNPRSTVGTVTEIHDYLRLLYARAGTPHCPDHDLPLEAQSVSQMVDHVLALPQETKLMILAPVVANRKGEQLDLFAELKAQGFVRLRVDGKVHDIDTLPKLAKTQKHSIDIVVDRLKVREDMRQRLAESFETALRHAEGRALAVEMDSTAEHLFSSKFACPVCNYALQELEPRLFSFNNPMGACSEVRRPRPDPVLRPGTHRRLPAPEPVRRRHQGLGQAQPVLLPDARIAGGALQVQHRAALRKAAGGHGQHRALRFGQRPDQVPYLNEKGTRFDRTHAFEGIIPNLERRYRETDSMAVREELAKYLNNKPCPECAGARLRREARHVFVGGKTITEISRLSLIHCRDFFNLLQLTGHKAQVGEKILKEITARLSFLINVGLDYLSLDRSAETLSGGEAQRIRLASQIGSGLTGVMYVLDEPSIGLHQRDNSRLLETLFHLRDLGNTVIVVEHDLEAIESADYVVDMGPGAGEHGGRVVAEGTPHRWRPTRPRLPAPFSPAGARSPRRPNARRPTPCAN
jgi:excinuclease ABC subunit A